MTPWISSEKPTRSSRQSQEHPPLSDITTHNKVPGSAVVTPHGIPGHHTRQCHGRHPQKHIPDLHPVLSAVLPIPSRESNSAQHPSTKGWAWVVADALQMLPPSAANVQDPCKSCLVVFTSSSSPKLWGPRPACAVLLNRQWCRPSQPTAIWCRQAWTDVTFFGWKAFSLWHQLLLQDSCCLHRSLCSALGSCRPTGEEQRWVFTQQSWPSFHEHACSGWGGLPQIASTHREERMTLTWT